MAIKYFENKDIGDLKTSEILQMYQDAGLPTPTQTSSGGDLYFSVTSPDGALLILRLGAVQAHLICPLFKKVVNEDNSLSTCKRTLRGVNKAYPQSALVRKYTQVLANAFSCKVNLTMPAAVLRDTLFTIGLLYFDVKVGTAGY